MAALQRLSSAEVVGRYPESDSDLIDRPASDAIVADATHVVEVIRTVLATVVPEVGNVDAH